MWRPKNWNNPYKDYFGTKELTIKEDYETNQHFSFEAGADAMKEYLTPYLLGATIPLDMLEALREEYNESQKGLASQRGD